MPRHVACVALCTELSSPELFRFMMTFVRLMLALLVFLALVLHLTLYSLIVHVVVMFRCG